MCTTAVGVSVLSQQNLDTVSVFGLDPFIVLGVATLGSGAVGWLLGPFVGNAVFGMRYRRIAGQIAEVSEPYLHVSNSFMNLVGSGRGVQWLTK